MFLGYERPLFCLRPFLWVLVRLNLTLIFSHPQKTQIATGYEYKFVTHITFMRTWQSKRAGLKTKREGGTAISFLTDALNPPSLSSSPSLICSAHLHVKCSPARQSWGIASTMMYPGFSFHDTPLGFILRIKLYDNSVEPSQYELTTRGCAMVSLSAVWWCSGKGERLGYERAGCEVQVRPWVVIFFLFHRKTFNNRSKIC